MRGIILMLPFVLSGILETAAMYLEFPLGNSHGDSYSNPNVVNGVISNVITGIGHTAVDFLGKILGGQGGGYQNAIASTYTNGDATGFAGASNGAHGLQGLDEFWRLITKQNNQNDIGYHNKVVVPNYALSSASVGPAGGYQTVYVNPANPNIPNINNHFIPTGPNGYNGVSVSSYSSSSDINGVKSNHRGGHATINDNGRITTYQIDS